MTLASEVKKQQNKTKRTNVKKQTEKPPCNQQQGLQWGHLQRGSGDTWPIEKWWPWLQPQDSTSSCSLEAASSFPGICSRNLGKLPPWKTMPTSPTGDGATKGYWGGSLWLIMITSAFLLISMCSQASPICWLASHFLCVCNLWFIPPWYWIFFHEPLCPPRAVLICW